MEELESKTTQILKDIENLEHKLAKTSYMSFTEAGEFLDKKPSVIAQYAKAGIIHPIRQGKKKLILLKEVYELEICMRALEFYGCSYTACKVLIQLIRDSGKSPQSYMNYLKSVEERANLTKEDIERHVNSYKHRGIFQKQKAGKSTEDI